MRVCLENLKKEIAACKHCADMLPHPPRPVIQVSTSSRILIVGQAPGRKVHETGIPFNDPSGDRLRNWMGIDRDIFYDASKVAIVPMGFCFPGTGKSGDLPPRPECAEKWRTPLLENLSNIELTLVIGQYAIAWHLKGQTRKNLTETVKYWQDYGDEIIPMPHPSPRNMIWLKRNPWFEQDVIPTLRLRVSNILSGKP
ncbi:MAG: IclR family transcriptional regulator [Alphaproteobacteria bacterium]|nr:MAG: IclR family transcriptional regulator [Alphaproteobacteria bacterium]